MKTALLIIALLAVCFGGGYWLGRSSSDIIRSTTVRVDTLFYERPTPVRVLPPTYASVRVSRTLFAPADTVVRVVGDSSTDSVDMCVTIEHKPYQDSTYRAQVSGPRIGNLGPTLDWIETYNRTTERVQTVTKRSRFAVTAGVGIGCTPQGVQPYVGVGVGLILWQF